MAVSVDELIQAQAMCGVTNRIVASRLGVSGTMWGQAKKGRKWINGIPVAREAAARGLLREAGLGGHQGDAVEGKHMPCDDEAPTPSRAATGVPSACVDSSSTLPTESVQETVAGTQAEAVQGGLGELPGGPETTVIAGIDSEAEVLQSPWMIRLDAATTASSQILSAIRQDFDLIFRLDVLAAVAMLRDKVPAQWVKIKEVAQEHRSVRDLERAIKQYKQQLDDYRRAESQADAWQAETGELQYGEGGLILPPGYRLMAQGLYWLDETQDGAWVKIANGFEVLAETRSSSGSAWGLLLCWRDHDGREHRMALSRGAFHTELAETVRGLVDEGLYIKTSTKHRLAVAEFLGEVRSKNRACCVRKPGWHQDRYVFPDEVMGGTGNGEQLVLQNAAMVRDHRMHKNGTLQDWQKKVGRFCKGNNRLIFACCMAAAPVLLRFDTQARGGIHVVGRTSEGKTVMLGVAGSVWGGPRKAGDLEGYIRTWRATGNNLELQALAHNDGLLCLDEIKEVDQRQAAQIAYMLGNGMSKGRNAGAQQAAVQSAFRMLFVSTGELTLADMVNEMGQHHYGGLEVRMVDIPSDAGKEMGIFEELHGSESSRHLAEYLEEAVRSHYGTPIRAFIHEVLTLDEGTIKERLGRTRQALEQGLRDDGHEIGGQVSRILRRFAMISVAGELASEAGIYPWSPEESRTAVARIVRDWLQLRGSASGTEDREILEHVRGFLQTHSARFGAIKHAASGGAGVPPKIKPMDTPSDPIQSRESIRDQAGWRKQRPEDRDYDFLIFPNVFKNAICAGYNLAIVLSVLTRRGLMEQDKNKPTKTVRLPGSHKPQRVYFIKAEILEA